MFNDPGDNIGPKSCDLWKPVIAAVNGMACGGAFYMLGEVEFIIAAEHATFFDPHVTYGMTAAFEPIHMRAIMPFPEIMRLSLLGNYERMSARARSRSAWSPRSCRGPSSASGRRGRARVIADSPAARDPGNGARAVDRARHAALRGDRARQPVHPDRHGRRRVPGRARSGSRPVSGRSGACGDERRPRRRRCGRDGCGLQAPVRRAGRAGRHPPAGLDAAAAELSDAGHDVHTHPTDVADAESVVSLVAAATALGAVTAVVHTAGVSPVQAPAETVHRGRPARGRAHARDVRRCDRARRRRCGDRVDGRSPSPPLPADDEAAVTRTRQSPSWRRSRA